MKETIANKEGSAKLIIDINEREKQERLATASVTSDILSQLSISIDTLPQRCQQLLQQAGTSQLELDIEEIDPIALSLHQSKEISEQLQDDYEILNLTHKNAELQARVVRNEKFLEELRKELVASRESLAAQNPNPENIQEHIRQLRQKVNSYEESCEKAKAKFSKLSVPESLLPSALKPLTTALLSAREQQSALQRRCEDAELARAALRALHTLSYNRTHV